MGFYGIDMYFIILVVPAILFSLWAQSRVTSTFAKYQKVESYSRMTGAEVARRILDNNDLYDVKIEQVAGNLSDHYDPRSRVVRLSQGVYGSTSIAAIGVAAHEVGHAVQHASRYIPLKARNAIIPVTNFGSKLSVPLIFIGAIAGMDYLINFGIILFASVTVFQLITLPVEFNASSRAMVTLDEQGILGGEELRGTRKVLSAAALTYVAALIVSAMQLLRLVLVFGRRRN